MHGSVSWKPWLYAALAAAVGLSGQQLVEHFQREQMRQHEHEHVTHELAGLRARLEGIITGNLLLVRGLGAVIRAQPDLDQAGFEKIAAGMVGGDSALRNIAGAPGLVVRLIYPLAGNEAVLGLDYRSHPTQREAAMHAVESGSIVVAGPLELVQGGTGLVARYPVHLEPVEPGGPGPLWGLVSAVIDIDRLYQQARLATLAEQLGLRLAIRGRDGRGADGAVFYGDPALFDDPAATAEVALPSGSWQLAAASTDGMVTHGHRGQIDATRLIGLVVSTLFAALAFAVARDHRLLKQAADGLRDSQALFAGFMDHLPAGAFIREPRSRRTLFENRWLREHLSEDEHSCGAPDEDGLAALRDAPQLTRHETDSPSGGNMICDTLRFVLPDGNQRELVGGIVMDVGERVRAERALADNRARLRVLLDTLPDLVWMKDPDGVFLACNARVEALLGAREADIIGRTDHDLMPAELADAFRRYDLAAIEADGPTRNEERVRFASDGHEELLETIKTPVRDVDGNLIGILGIARDITEREAMTRELRDKVAELTRWQGVILGREDRIQELKQEVNRLLRAQGEAPRYRPPTEDT